MIQMGQRLGDGGRYEVSEVLGHGGMASVFRGFDTRLHAVVAIKVLSDQLLTNAKVRRRFRHEAQIQATLRHPNIVRSTDWIESPDVMAIVMEHVAGPDLGTYLQTRGPLTPGEALELMRPVLQAVGHAHDANVVHRDLKPQNILLDMTTGTPRPMVVDFGVAKILTLDGPNTDHGARIGTPGYMAPEQLRGMPDVGRMADVFALGAILFELCTGQPPFATHGTRVPPPSSIVPGIGRRFDALIAAATATDRHLRVPSTSQLLIELEGVIAEGDAPAPPVPPEPPEPAKRPPVATWAMVGLVAACLVGGAVWALDAKREADERAERAEQAQRAAVVKSARATAARERAEKDAKAQEAAAKKAAEAKERAEKKARLDAEEARKKAAAVAAKMAEDKRLADEKQAADEEARKALEARAAEEERLRQLAQSKQAEAERRRAEAEKERAEAQRAAAAAVRAKEAAEKRLKAGLPRDLRRRLKAAGLAPEHGKRCSSVRSCRRAASSAHGVDKAHLMALACGHGDAESCAEAAHHYSNTRGASRDPELAAQLRVVACQMGHAHQCNSLGYMYGLGKGVRQDFREAARLYKKACDLGSLLGCTNLAARYIDGPGVPGGRDVDRAARIYRRACRHRCTGEPFCEKGKQSGCTSLGKMMMQGKGVSLDHARGRALVRRQCNAGYKPACKAL